MRPDLIQFAGDRMRVRFDRLDADAYRLFLRCKALPEMHVLYDDEAICHTIDAPARYAHLLGATRPAPEIADLPFSSHLFGDQTHIVRAALECKRYACWSDCGLGKTSVGLEFARQVLHRTETTQGRVLVTTVAEVVRQWGDESKRFYGDSLPLQVLRSRAHMEAWCAGLCPDEPRLAITNYEKWNPAGVGLEVISAVKNLAGVILDESSRLKSGGGKQKWAIIKSCRGIEYKLSLTATPAPNEVMEFASQASFLEKMRTETDIIWTYFRRDETTYRWTVKPHARAAFFRFMADWSIYVASPKRYGWRLDLPDVPAPVETVHTVEITPAQHAEWMERSVEPDGQRRIDYERSTNAIQRMKLAQIARGFCYLKDDKGKYRRLDSGKPAVCADLVRDEVAAGRPTILWTAFDAEAEIIADLLREREVGFAVLTGKTPRKQRARLIRQFQKGHLDVLLTRPSVLGFGMNFQNCKAMVFSGIDDSFESRYQAIRRAYRFGQVDALRVHVVIVQELEGDSWSNLQRKEAQFLASIAEMETNYLESLRGLGMIERRAA